MAAEFFTLFEAKITRPNGVIIRAEVTIPAGTSDRDILELTQMTVGNLSKMVDKSLNEVPF